MKTRASVALVLAVLIAATPCLPLRAQSGGAVVNVWMTTGDRSNLLTAQPAVSFAADAGTNTWTIDVDEATSYQQMDGFGASFTDSSAWLVSNALTADQRTALMTKLFDATGGIGLSSLRQPMGASDFARSNYTYDDVAAGQTDLQLAAFSVDHDRAYIIPLLQDALLVNPSLRIIAVPWSAPAWMKTNGSLFGGSLKADPATLTAFASYFVKFIQAYGAAGVPIHRVVPQNEPLNTSSTYPTMYMDAGQQADVIANYLGPALRDNGLGTTIAAYDHNWDNTSYADSVLNSTAAPFVTGSAWHCYAGTPDAMTVEHNLHPDKDIYFTECSAGTWSTSFSSNLKWDMETLIIGAPRNWARTISKWNIALDDNNGPQNGGCSNCTGLVTIDRSTSPATVGLNYDYYALGHISKFVRPGAYRVASNTFGSGSIEDVAFLNPDGSRALIVLNDANQQRTFKVRAGGQSFTYTLPAGAAATFTWQPGAPQPADQPPTVSIATPPDGATYTAPATISLTADASDQDGSVTKVSYYAGSSLIGSATTSPYTVRWKVGAGTYTLTAVAIDNSGSPTTSAPVTVKVGKRK